jgi:hypothetical protein
MIDSEAPVGIVTNLDLVKAFADFEFCDRQRR